MTSVSLTAILLAASIAAGAPEPAENAEIAAEMATIEKRLLDLDSAGAIIAARRLGERLSKGVAAPPAQIATAYGRMGNALTADGEIVEGKRWLDESVKRFREMASHRPNTPDLARADIIATAVKAHRRLGRRETASALIVEGLALLPPDSSTPLRATFLLEMAQLSSEVGDYAAATKSTEEAVKILAKPAASNPGQLSHARAALGDLYRQAGRHQDAREMYSVAGKYYNGRDPLSPLEWVEYLDILVGINLIRRDTGTLVEARERLAGLEKMFGPKVNADATVRLARALASAHAKEGTWPAARESQEKAVSRSESLFYFDPGLRAETLAEAALIDWSGGDRTTAKTRAAEALEAVTSMLENGLPNQPDHERMTSFRRWRSVLDVYLSTAEGHEDAKTLYGRVLRWKASAFRRSRLDNALAKSPASAGKIREATDRVVEATERLRNGRLKASADVRALNRAVTDARNSLAQSVAAAAEWTRPDPNAVIDSLPSDAVFVDFVTYTHYPAGAGKFTGGSPAILAFVITHQGIDVRAIPGTAGIKKLIGSKSLLEGPDDPTGMQLRQALFGSLTEELRGKKRLAISPDDYLWQVPFAGLRGRDGRFLVEDFIITHLMSGLHLVETADRRTPPAGRMLLAGAPDYGPQTSGGLRPVPDGADWLERELAGLAARKQPGPRVLGGKLATGPSLRNALVEPWDDVVWLGHGLPSPPVSGDVSPLFGDGLLPVATDSADLAAEFHVPMSGYNLGRTAETSLNFNTLGPTGHPGAFWMIECFGGDGRIVALEGIIGIPRLLHLRGFDTVVSSPRLVVVPTARDFFRRACGHAWGSGKCPAEAVALAQREFVKKGGNSVAPRYWAHWMVTGDSGFFRDAGDRVEPVIGETRPATLWKRVAGILSALVIAVGVAWIIRRFFRRRNRHENVDQPPGQEGLHPD